MNSQTEHRPILDWVIFSIIFIVLTGAIGYAGFVVYGGRLGLWVGASAFIAALVHLYLFAKVVPGETLMKVWLGLCIALNAGYLVHNGAKAVGIEAFNNAQVKKFEIGMGKAAQAQSRSIASAIGMNARQASEIAKLFDDGVALIAALLAFLELSSALVLFAIASKRVARIERTEPIRNGEFAQEEIPLEK